MTCGSPLTAVATAPSLARPAPDPEPALCLAAVELGLLGPALTLLILAFSQRRPQTASDPAAPPAAGGSSAPPDMERPTASPGTGTPGLVVKAILFIRREPEPPPTNLTDSWIVSALIR